MIRLYAYYSRDDGYDAHGMPSRFALYSVAGVAAHPGAYRVQTFTLDAATPPVPAMASLATIENTLDAKHAGWQRRVSELEP
jgi:hypothetical protein